MRFLSLSLVLLFVSCASYPEKQQFQSINDQADFHNVYFSNVEKDYVYKASIEVYDKVFGGIFIVKKIDDLHHRVVFTTEMGNKILDFSFDKEAFKVNSILEALDKKILINVLKKDFKVLITENLKLKAAFKSDKQTVGQTVIDSDDYFYFGTNPLNKIVKSKCGKAQVVFTFSEISNNIAHNINIQHFNIKFKMGLKSIN
ncbi:hypothetical protein F6U93_04535 [Tamlana haliotis]|uniref:DUF4292 domain-containing protein n=1 Tax=Pseudotamlana haliotis TaxID=2614804 RepID=A0A6N6MFX9_9FLAO|nr:hypothetical protein F6U93_04535 [Tamlana haliotis]